MKHHELKTEDFHPMMGGILEKAGWVSSEKDGEIVYNRPGSFGSRDLCVQDAYKIQQMVDKWGNQ